jgi:hypothetical protein
MTVRAGKVWAVCTSPNPGLPKYPQSTGAIVGQFGLIGDYHNREMRPDFKYERVFYPNDRQITIVAWEVMEWLNKELQLNLKPGDLGENITSYFAGDLSYLNPGDEIRIGDKIRLEVVKQNKPCSKAVAYVGHRMFSKTIYSPEYPRRGVICKITSGIGSLIKPYDQMRIPWRVGITPRF